MMITIDGPSGSGKSSLAIKIAQHLHFSYLNSGYLYRGLTYVLQTFYGYDEQKMQNIDIADVQACLTSGNFEYRYEFGLAKVVWSGVDITQHLKDAHITKLVLYVAQDVAVRNLMLQFELTFVQKHDVVIEGRACGSSSFPHAEIKFYLTASDQVRALRYQADQRRRGHEITAQDALTFMQLRDTMDAQRAIDPLIKPQGAIELDSTHDSLQEVLQKALDAIKKHMKSASKK